MPNNDGPFVAIYRFIGFSVMLNAFNLHDYAN